MAKKFVEIDNLTPDAQMTAVKKFANFYLQLQKDENLDVVSEMDKKDVITSINLFIFDNISFTHDELLNRLVENRQPEFVTLIAQTGQKFSEDGQAAEQTWPQWLADREKGIDTKEALS
ncbi:hypothetical protein FHQ08_08740 [Lactobacillus sp. CC-MHH1034]|uniref:hypothetical protein n=1 Tax=Agrilactobacillus fermenti TaxID=2586909 RepID=UPI001E4F101F|nr:hypothetical protein [Agrilactobacillus fermenti]MCD2256809.1 hypothetical protein [Agrilactobacillus fermenti]